MHAASLPRSVLIIAGLALTAIVLLPDGGEGAPEPPSLFNMEFVSMPESMELYPTYSTYRPVHLPGTLNVENYHPEDVRLYLNASIDSAWSVIISPLHIVVPVTRSILYNFDVVIQMPPYTYGPEYSLLAITVEARTSTRTIATERIEVWVHIVNNVDQMVDGLSEMILVDAELRAFSGFLWLYNIMDEPQVFHICTLGDSAEVIQDLEFKDSVLLNAKERRKEAFSGTVSKDLELGTYRVDLGLWTPDGEGGRSVILNFTLEMNIFSTKPTLVDDFFAYYYFTFPMTIGLSTTAACYVVWLWRRRRQRALSDRAWEEWEGNRVWDG